MDQIEVGGLNIACGRTGHGPALLLLDGAYCDSRVWRWQHPRSRSLKQVEAAERFNAEVRSVLKSVPS